MEKHPTSQSNEQISEVISDAVVSAQPPDPPGLDLSTGTAAAHHCANNNQMCKSGVDVADSSQKKKGSQRSRTVEKRNVKSKGVSKSQKASHASTVSDSSVSTDRSFVETLVRLRCYSTSPYHTISVEHPSYANETETVTSPATSSTDVTVHIRTRDTSSSGPSSRCRGGPSKAAAKAAKKPPKKAESGKKANMQGHGENVSETESVSRHEAAGKGKGAPAATSNTPRDNNYLTKEVSVRVNADDREQTFMLPIGVTDPSKQMCIALKIILGGPTNSQSLGDPVTTPTPTTATSKQEMSPLLNSSSGANTSRTSAKTKKNYNGSKKSTEKVKNTKTRQCSFTEDTSKGSHSKQPTPTGTSGSTKRPLPADDAKAARCNSRLSCRGGKSSQQQHPATSTSTTSVIVTQMEKSSNQYHQMCIPTPPDPNRISAHLEELRKNPKGKLANKNNHHSFGYLDEMAGGGGGGGEGGETGESAVTDQQSCHCWGNVNNNQENMELDVSGRIFISDESETGTTGSFFLASTSTPTSPNRSYPVDCSSLKLDLSNKNITVIPRYQEAFVDVQPYEYQIRLNFTVDRNDLLNAIARNQMKAHIAPSPLPENPTPSEVITTATSCNNTSPEVSIMITDVSTPGEEDFVNVSSVVTSMSFSPSTSQIEIDIVTDKSPHYRAKMISKPQKAGYQVKTRYVVEDMKISKVELMDLVRSLVEEVVKKCLGYIIQGQMKSSSAGAKSSRCPRKYSEVKFRKQNQVFYTEEVKQAKGDNKSLYKATLKPTLYECPQKDFKVNLITESSPTTTTYKATCQCECGYSVAMNYRGPAIDRPTIVHLSFSCESVDAEYEEHEETEPYGDRNILAERENSRSANKPPCTRTEQQQRSESRERDSWGNSHSLTKLTLSSIMKITPSWDDRKNILQGKIRPSR